MVFPGMPNLPLFAGQHFLLIVLVALQINVLTRPNGEYYILIVLAVILIYNWRLWRYAVLLVAGFRPPADPARALRCAKEMRSSMRLPPARRT